MGIKMTSDEVSDELEALKAIYNEDFQEISLKPPCFMVKLEGLDAPLRGPIAVKISLPDDYPDVAPLVELPSRSHVLTATQQDQLLSHVAGIAADNTGFPMVYMVIEAAKEWINLNISESNSVEQEPVMQESDSSTASANVTLVEPSVSGGRWDFVIGLVGKPSAGKSTFFNAATTHDAAKTGAHPFTTIEPNIGKAFYTVPCPCARLGQRCDAAYGHNFAGERHIPVLLKDVAGLVPGACDGKGRGNRFLNDLVDADVLIHIVDVSGCTDDRGEATTGYDPALDVMWLQQEIHQWIYQNIRDKWQAIVKRPMKLIDMFTGYHANKGIIYAALQSAGIGEQELAGLRGWDDSVLHTLVTQFLRIRFPIFLALNKCDTLQAQQNILRIQERFPDANSLPVSARVECQLQTLQKAGHIQYHHGDRCWQAVDGLSADDSQQLTQINNNVLNCYQSTNVQRAVSLAVGLRQLVYAYPVACLDSLTSIDKYRGEPPGMLRDGLCLHPHTTVLNLYNAMAHYPLYLAAGDFIRAECLEQGKKRIMKKDEELNNENCILKIFTNRKVSLIKPKE